MDIENIISGFKSLKNLGNILKDNNVVYISPLPGSIKSILTKSLLE